MNNDTYNITLTEVQVERYTHIELCIELSRGSHVSIQRPHCC